DAPTQYWVEAPDGAMSQRYRVVPIDPLLVSELVVEIRYPAYLNRIADRFEGEVPPLELPEGTRLAIRGAATRAIETAALVDIGSGARIRFEVRGDRFL